MKNDTSNIVEMPIPSGGSTPLQVARALLEYIKAHPSCDVVAVVKVKEDSTISMGWSEMDAGEMSLMLRYANFRWERSTFEEIE